MKRIFIFFVVIGNLFFITPIRADKSTEEIFAQIYSDKVWGANAQGIGWSGPGSTIENTIIYREFIQDFLKTYHIASVVDLGCGDWSFSRSISWEGIDYTGLDVVSSLIERNRMEFESENIHFYKLNAIEAQMPKADLLICKDVFQHLTNDDVLKIIKQLGKYKYCLITNDVYSSTLTSDNREIARGDYRPIDLTKPPFNIKGIKALTFNSQNVTKQTLFICSPAQ